MPPERHCPSCSNWIAPADWGHAGWMTVRCPHCEALHNLSDLVARITATPYTPLQYGKAAEA